MKQILSGQKENAYALLRIVSGFLFFCHGAQKLFGVMGGEVREMFSLIWIAGVVEFVAGLMLIVGFMAGFAAFLSSGQMLVAYFMAHAGQALWPIQNRGELALLYCFLFLFMMMKGAGKWSVDNR